MCRQLALCIAYLAAQFVPKLLHGIGTYLFLHINGNLGQTGAVFRLQIIKLAQRLYGFFEHIGHLLLHFQRRSAGISRGHYGLLDGERCVLQLTHTDVRDDASQQYQPQ